MPDVSKLCSRCGTVKPAKAFNRNARAQSGLQDWCRQCASEHQRGYRQGPEGRERVKAWHAEAKRVAAEAVWRYLVEHPCCDCGETDPVVLEFDHVYGDKVCAVSTMARNGAPWSRIAAEIDKCVVRCANCHRRKTAAERGWYANIGRAIQPEGETLQTQEPPHP